MNIRITNEEVYIRFDALNVNFRYSKQVILDTPMHKTGLLNFGFAMASSGLQMCVPAALDIVLESVNLSFNRWKLRIK